MAPDEPFPDEPAPVPRTIEELQRLHSAEFARRIVDTVPMRMEDRLGQVIRDRRQELALKLADLARAAGISIAMLSRLENGRTSVSLDALVRICAALGIEMSEVFRQAENRSGEAHQVKAAEQLLVVRTGTRHGHVYKLLSWQIGTTPMFEAFLIDMRDDQAATYARFRHGGQEFLHMLEGRMRYRCGDRIFMMEPGDSLTFTAETIHGVDEMLDSHIQFLSILIDPGRQR